MQFHNNTYTKFVTHFSGHRTAHSDIHTCVHMCTQTNVRQQIESFCTDNIWRWMGSSDNMFGIHVLAYLDDTQVRIQIGGGMAHNTQKNMCIAH